MLNPQPGIDKWMGLCNITHALALEVGWNATGFVFLSDDCVSFKVSTTVYNGTVIITWQDNVFFIVQFRDIELKVMGIPNAEEVIDAVKDYIEDGEVWV